MLSKMINALIPQMLVCDNTFLHNVHIQTCTHACTNTRTHTHTHTHMHTHTLYYCVCNTINTLFRKITKKLTSRPVVEK